MATGITTVEVTVIITTGGDYYQCELAAGYVELLIRINCHGSAYNVLCSLYHANFEIICVIKL